MNRTNTHLFFVLSALLFIIGIVIYWFTDTYSTFRVAERDFSVSNEHEIVRIEMISYHTESRIELWKDDQDRWRLNENMFANELAVRELEGLLTRIRVRQPVSIAHAAKVDEMLENRGVRVNVFILAHRIRIGGLKLWPYQRMYQSFVVGDDTPDGESTYMRKSPSAQAFKMHRPGLETGISSLFIPEERVWRDPVIFDMEPEEVASVTVLVPDDPDESFTLKNLGSEGFLFLDPQQQQPLDFAADTARTIRFLSSFKDIHYELLPDKIGELQRKELMFEQPFMIITVESIRGETIRMNAYARRTPPDVLMPADGIDRDPNRFYVQVNQGEYAQAQYYVFNRILRPRSFFQK